MLATTTNPSSSGRTKAQGLREIAVRQRLSSIVARSIRQRRTEMNDSELHHNLNRGLPHVDEKPTRTIMQTPSPQMKYCPTRYSPPTTSSNSSSHRQRHNRFVVADYHAVSLFIFQQCFAGEDPASVALIERSQEADYDDDYKKSFRVDVRSRIHRISDPKVIQQLLHLQGAKTLHLSHPISFAVFSYHANTNGAHAAVAHRICAIDCLEFFQEKRCFNEIFVMDEKKWEECKMKILFS